MEVLQYVLNVEIKGEEYNVYDTKRLIEEALREKGIVCNFLMYNGNVTDWYSN